MSQLAAVVAGVALSGAALVFAAGAITSPHDPARDGVTPLPADVPSAPIGAPATAMQPADPEPDPLMLVFHAGDATYVSLADLPDSDDHRVAIAMPRHGELQRSHDRDADITAAIAAVADRDVPAAYQRWQGRRVSVDDVCTATVVGFAVVARRVGDRGRAGAPRPSAAAVLRSGHAVLAARLDRCTGSFAHDAAASLTL